LAAVVLIVCVLVPVMLFCARAPSDIHQSHPRAFTSPLLQLRASPRYPKQWKKHGGALACPNESSVCNADSYSFNLDGTTLYLAMASVFVAQPPKRPPATHGVLGPADRYDLTLMITSKGVAWRGRAQPW